MDDIYSWILSPEIREYLRGNYKPDLMERQALICGAYRPIEEKLSALQTLCGEAESEEERASLERAVERYQLAIREIRQCRQDEFYLSRTALQFGGDTWLYAYPFNYLGELKTDISRCYDDLSGGDPSVYCPVSCGYQVKKWRCGKVWEPMLSFDLRPMGKEYRTTRFYLYDTLLEQANLSLEGQGSGCKQEECRPLPFPFSTGDLVCLDAPLFERPVYGVLCRWTSIDSVYNGELYTLLGYMENGILRAMDLSEQEIAFDGSGYRVIDWLRRASSEELPAGQEVFGEIGAQLRCLNRRDRAAAKDQFLQIFVRGQKKEGLFIRQVVGEDTLCEMARVGFVPVGASETVEVYVHTDDTGQVPHFHVRKYHAGGNGFGWEVCVKYLSAEYFFHGCERAGIPSGANISGKDLNRFFDAKKADGRTYWQIAVNAWNDNNSGIELPADIQRPDYSELF